jgi:hypothetical protein
LPSRSESDGMQRRVVLMQRKKQTYHATGQRVLPFIIRQANTSVEQTPANARHATSRTQPAADSARFMGRSWVGAAGLLAGVARRRNGHRTARHDRLQSTRWRKRCG